MSTPGRALKAVCWISPVIYALTAGASPAPLYDLSRVDGMNGFGGGPEAQQLLAKQGFVVAAPEFIQMFQAYIKSPVPVFVTTDSAWHTFHIVFEEGVKEMERAQAQRQVQFSRRLLEAAQAQSTEGPEFQALAFYASIGLAFQDEDHRKSISTEQKRLLENLLKGTQPVDAPIGFPLSPVQFRPQSFYIESPELSAFYSAHQWYAAVDFRLSNPEETKLALCLSWLIENDPELLNLWKRLTEPYDRFVALPEDGTVLTYNRVAQELLSDQLGPEALRSQITTLQKKLQVAVPVARINDQYLSPEEYENFGKLTKGFRLLPGRQLPCGVCFQNTVDPKIHGRMFPSGLDFMAASPVMRSPAALRALESQFGKATAQAIQKAECPAMPDSLYGQSMELLARLQERLPSSVAQPLRTDAWADVQLWTQLAAWSEQRHTWALYTKNGAGYGGGVTPPPGVVAPYPAFFAGLAKLARDTAKAFDSTADQNLEPKAMAAEMLQMVTLMRNNYNGMGEKELAPFKDKLNHFSRFMMAYQAAHQSEMFKGSKLTDDLEELLRRIVATGETTPAAAEVLKLCSETRLASVMELNGFAEMCQRLAKFAQKNLEGKQLDHDEANWLRDYGKTMAACLHTAYEVPFDDFSLVTRIFDNPLVNSVLYAGVARPQALYVILPYKNRLQLYRGTVLSYREFVRPENERLDDKSWRTLVAEGKAPAPPPFTQSFLRPEKPDPNQKKAGMAGRLKPGQPGRIKIEVKEVSLGPSPKEWVWREGWITPSEDCRHVAYRARNAGKWRIFRDGVPGKEYDEAHYQWFSPDNEHLAYVARTADKSCVVLDGREGPGFSAITETTKHYWPFVFSSDSTHLAYVATTENRKQCVVVDGNRGPEFDEVMHHSFSFSEDSKHFAYAATLGGKGVIIKDGKEILRGDGVVSGVQSFGATRVGETFGPFLSPDGSRLACAVRHGTNCFVVVDGVESGPWDNVDCLVAPREEFARFSPDGRHFAYVGMRKDRYFAVVDQKEKPDSWMECAVFSPDSKHVAFARFSEDSEKRTVSSVVLDGVPGKGFSGTIEAPVFSPDGKRLAYRVSESIVGGGYMVEHGGEEFDDYYSSGEIIFSPDSRHLAFHGSRNSQSFLVIDGHEYLQSDQEAGSIHCDYFTFSPDSKQWAYIALHDGGQYGVISGVEYGPYEFLSIPDEEAYIYFSPDSRHFAFMATRGYRQSNYRGGKQYLVVDGHDYEIQGASWLSGSVLRFDSATKLHGLIMGPERIARLEVEIQPNRHEAKPH